MVVLVTKGSGLGTTRTMFIVVVELRRTIYNATVATSIGAIVVTVDIILSPPLLGHFGSSKKGGVGGLSVISGHPETFPLKRGDLT